MRAGTNYRRAPLILNPKSKKPEESVHMSDLRLLFPKTNFVRDMSCRAGWCFATSNQVLKSTWSAPKVFGKRLMPSKKPTISIHGLLVFPWSSRWVYKPAICFSSSSSSPYRRRNLYQKICRTMECLRGTLSFRHKFQNQTQLHA